MRNEQIPESVARQVPRPDRGGRVPRKNAAFGKRPGSIIDAHVVGAAVLRSAPVRDDDLGSAVAVQVGHGDVPGGPGWVAEGPGEDQGTRPIAQIDALVVGTVVAHHQVEVAIPIQIGERRGVGVVRRAGELMALLEASRPVVQEYPVLEGPVAALGEDNVEIPVPVEIPEARVRAGFGGVLERDRLHPLGAHPRRREQQSAKESADHAGASSENRSAVGTAVIRSPIS